MAASLKGKRTPITTPPYQVPSVDITPDPPIFSLVTTFNEDFYLPLYLREQRFAVALDRLDTIAFEGPVQRL